MYTKGLIKRYEMIAQIWIKNKDMYMAGITHWPYGQEPKSGVLLVPGFSQPKSDVNYFMSKLARRLVGAGFFVLQLDPGGHGDSNGILGDVNLDTLRSDIETAVEYVKSQAKAPVYGIGRGLSAVLLAECTNKGLTCGTAGINPYCLDLKAAADFWKDICDETYEVAELFEFDYDKKLDDFDYNRSSFFVMLGADMGNLRGQKVSGKLLMQLGCYDSIKVLKENCRKNLWLHGDSTDEWQPVQPETGYLLKRFKYNSIPEDPHWQHRAIDKLCQWLEGKVKTV
jgi:hypothetical protein